MNEAKFEAKRYLESRPLYPPCVYDLLAKGLRGKSVDSFLDLGCGTGQSTFSFATLGLARSGIACDADPKMIAGARNFPRPSGLAGFPIEFQVGPAEALPLNPESVDLVLIGSAIHWFRIGEAKREIERVLKPGGFLFVYEYQFPKALDHPDLNEFIRRKFNTEWKAPRQVPRGTLAELLTPFSDDSLQWENREEARPNWIQELSLNAFLGNLFSQSRYLHGEAASPDPTKYQQMVMCQIEPYFSSGPLRFDFKPRAFRLQRRRIL